MREAIEILEYISLREEVLNKEREANSISITDLSFHCQLYELGKLREYIEAWSTPKDIGYTATYRFTNKLCYDKPPGVPIYHGETKE